MKKPQTRTATTVWHKPLCSHCRNPIEHIDHALAGWFEDDNGRTFAPQVVHVGAYCDYYTHSRSAPAVNRILDIPVEGFRRAPMEPVIIAMRRRDEDEASRLVWHLWISVVLGLPFNRWDYIGALRVHGEVADDLPDRVPSVEEVRRDIAPRSAGVVVDQSVGIVPPDQYGTDLREFLGDDDPGGDH